MLDRNWITPIPVLLAARIAIPAATRSAGAQRLNHRAMAARCRRYM
jgi:hypothetical protein